MNSALLSMTLYPIMDAYSQPHSGFKIFDTDVFSLNNIVTHWYESSLILPGNRGRFSQSVDATDWLTRAIISLPKDTGTFQICQLYATWFDGYIYK